MAFLTSAIGSFPVPPALEQARLRFAEGELDAAALREEVDDATRGVLALQDELGISLAVGGEMEQADLIASFAEGLTGVEIEGWVRVLGDRYVRRPKITGALGKTASTTVERWRFARGAARGTVKAVLPGPYSLMDGSFDEHYGSRRAACAAFAEIVRDEAAELAAAGATEIQLDEPAAGVRPDELPFLREALELIMAPLRGRSRVWLYLGYPDLRETGKELATLPANGLLVAGAHCECDGLEAFAAAVPGDRFVGVGVVDVLDAKVETEDEIRDRAATIAALIPRDRVWLVPDGGFRALRPETAKAKLAAMIAASK